MTSKLLPDLLSRENSSVAHTRMLLFNRLCEPGYIRG